jgi:TubC N-terminal docking domain
MSQAAITEILVELVRQGIQVAPHGAELRFKPLKAMSAELRARIAPHKTEILDLLTGRKSPDPPGQCPDKADRGSLPSALSVATAGGPAHRLVEDHRPKNGCWNCAGRDFIRVSTGPNWICARCHPPLTGVAIVDRWTAPEPSLRDETHAVKTTVVRETAALFDTREVDDVG